MSALKPLIDAFAELRVMVIGDALLDEYLLGAGTRIAREAPVPQVGVEQHWRVPGGAANVAANVAAMGAGVRYVGVVGDDPDGAALVAALEAAGVPTEDVVVERGRTTIAKRRLVAGDQILLRFDEGQAAVLGPDTRDLLLSRLPEQVRAADVVIVSDYAYGLLDDDLVACLARLHRQSPRAGASPATSPTSSPTTSPTPTARTTVVDARSVGRFRSLRPTAVTPSHDEIRDLLAPVSEGAGGDRADAVRASCARLHEATGAQIVAVTLDRDGAVVCERDRSAYRTWARPVPHSQACGAGDTFAAAFALALGAGAGAPAAAELAQAAATVVTGRNGTAVCSAADLRAHLTSTTTSLEHLDDVVAEVAPHRRHGRRIVFTNGCFDLLHHGHVDLLNRAKTLGDVLVVGLNSDASIRRLHGPDRPIVPLDERARVLAALSAVDHLVAFDETTAADLVTRLRPDVYVKGGDYLPSMLPEAPFVEAYGGSVQILPYLEDRTTVELIRRIRGQRPGASPSDQVEAEP